MLGHLVGIAEDWVDGRLERYATPGWTDDQVRRHRSDDPAQLAVGWATALDQLDHVGVDPVMGEPWRWLFGDALTHEADLYETFDADRRPPTDAIAAGLAAAIVRWRHHLAGATVPALEVVVPTVRVWWVGLPGGEHVTLRVDAYDLWRFLYGRTNRRCVEEWAWSRDPSPYLDTGLPFPFTFPAAG